MSGGAKGRASSRPVTSVSRASRVASPTPRSKFLFMHLAEPQKAPVRGPGRRKSEVGRMLRRPAGQEDLADLELEDAAGDDQAIDPVLSNILGLGSAKGGGGGAAADDDDFEEEDEDEEDEEDEDEEGEAEEDDDEDEDDEEGEGEEDELDASEEDGSERAGAGGGFSSRRAGGGGGLRGPALSMARFGGGSGTLYPPAARSAASMALNSRILRAARELTGVKDGGGSGGSGGSGSGSSGAASGKVVALPAAAFASNYAERRALLREDREQKVERRMMEMVHKGQMPPELLLDEDLAQSSKLDADAFEDDPDAYDSDELLGSDVSSISSTDEETDTPEKAARRDRRRTHRRRAKVRVLKKRRRRMWAKKRRDLDMAKSRYYDDMIDQLVMDNPLLRPPAAAADLDTKRSFVDRATAENLTRAKIDQMASWIRAISVVVENLGMITGFLMFEGLSVAVDAELRKPELQPIIAQLARKYLRRGPSSPEWGLAIMMLGTAGTIHAMNVRNQEAAASAAGKGASTGPASSKVGKLVSGAMKMMKVFGFGGGGGPEPAAAMQQQPQPHPAAMPHQQLHTATAHQVIASRYAAAQEPTTRGGGGGGGGGSSQPLPRRRHREDDGDGAAADEDGAGSRAPWDD
jgi:hypothetical protein